MNILEAIRTRRSVRKFRAEPVPRELIAQLLDALFASPSAMDSRPWQFVVIDDRELLRKLGTEMAHCEMLLEAPLGILICSEPAREKAPGFWPQDCAAATQNLLLAVHGCGLGGVWVGLYPMEDRMVVVRRHVGVPESVVPFALVAIGRPAEFPGPEDRFDAGKLHWNRWGQRPGAWARSPGPPTAGSAPG